MTEIAINGYRAYVEEFGSGSPVVLVHGLGGTGTDIWKRQLADLAKEYRVIAYDLRGSGQSEVTPGPYSIDLLTEDLRAVVAALRLGRVALVGPLDGRLDRALVRRAASRGRARARRRSARRRSSPSRDGREWRREPRPSRRRAWEQSPRPLRRTASPPTFREHNPEEFQELISMLAA